LNEAAVLSLIFLFDETFLLEEIDEIRRRHGENTAEVASVLLRRAASIAAAR